MLVWESVSIESAYPSLDGYRTLPVLAIVKTDHTLDGQFGRDVTGDDGGVIVVRQDQPTVEFLEGHGFSPENPPNVRNVDMMAK
ncbi:MAG: hypothetical protein IT335_11640 [Thermomicrobiales bacterium]|nr:hypothetical protein [Thermomicrobiales bacterium]